MLLSELLSVIQPIEIIGSTDKEIKGLHFDSRKIGEGDLFVAQVGTAVDGHSFIDGCVAKGATAVVLSDRAYLPPSTGGSRGATYILVENTDKALGLIASKWFGEPSKSLTLVGVTGTNGKTTIATLLYKLVRALGHKAGLLSTVVNYIEDEAVPATQDWISTVRCSPTSPAIISTITRPSITTATRRNGSLTISRNQLLPLPTRMTRTDSS